MSIYLFVCLCVSFNSLSLSFVLFKISLASIFYFSKMFPIRSRLFSTSLSLSLCHLLKPSLNHSHNSLFSHRTGNKKNQIFYQSSVLNLKPTQFLSFSLSLSFSFFLSLSLSSSSTHTNIHYLPHLSISFSLSISLYGLFFSLSFSSTHTQRFIICHLTSPSYFPNYQKLVSWTSPD